MLNFDLVKILIENKIEKSYSLSFKLKTSSTLVLRTKNLSVSNKIAKLSSLRDFQYDGKIKLFGKDISLLKNKEIINYRNQISIAGGDDPLFNNISIINNIVLPLRVRNFSKENMEKRVEVLISWLNLNSIIYNEVKNLNEYELKLLQIVRAIITNPKILILINPLSLNSSFNEIFLKIIKGLMSYNTTLLILENLNYNYQGVLQDFKTIKFHSSEK